MYYLILIFLNPGKHEVLRQYEKEAVHLMARHGGRFEHVFQPQSAPESEIPDEVHLLNFDTDDGFQAFRADPDLNQFKGLREEAVRKAIVLPMTDYPLSDYFKESDSNSNFHRDSTVSL